MDLFKYRNVFKCCRYLYIYAQVKPELSYVVLLYLQTHLSVASALAFNINII